MKLLFVRAFVTSEVGTLTAACKVTDESVKKLAEGYAKLNTVHPIGCQQVIEDHAKELA